jgi:hypothetical protein
MFENPTVILNALCNSCANIAYCLSELIFRVSLCCQQHPKFKLDICLLYPHLFCIFYPSSNPTNKNVTVSKAKFKHLYFGNHSQLDTHIPMNFFLTVADTGTLKKYWPSFLNNPVYSQVQRSTLPAKDQFGWPLTSLTAVHRL